MSKKKFVIIWPFLLFLGSLGTFEIANHLARIGDLSYLPQMYMFCFFNGPYVSYTYTAFAFSALIISLVVWLKRPNIWTLLGTIIAAWGLCGIVFIYITIRFHYLSGFSEGQLTLTLKLYIKEKCFGVAMLRFATPARLT